MLGFIIFLIFCVFFIIFIVKLIKEDYKAVNEKPDKNNKSKLDDLNEKDNPTENKKNFESFLKELDSNMKEIVELPMSNETKEQLKTCYACYGKEINEIPFSNIVQSDIIYLLVKARICTCSLNSQNGSHLFDFFNDVFPTEIITNAQIRLVSGVLTNPENMVNNFNLEDTLPSLFFFKNFIEDMCNSGIIDNNNTDGLPSWVITVFLFINDLIDPFFEYGDIPAEDFEYQNVNKCLAELFINSPNQKKNVSIKSSKKNLDGILKTEHIEKQLYTETSFETDSNLDSLLKELNSLIGLSKVKDEVNTLINLVKIRKLRESQGLKQIPISLHLVFSGNPGTGKTTVARLLAKIYKQLGILSKGQLIETDRSGLVAGYVGQTALKTQEVIEKAKGGILFIDEAYSLTSSSDSNDFGKEAVDTLLKAMEDMREDFIVIVAGYPDLMKQFLKSNPGLESRFNNFIYFEDYQPEDLFEIFKSMCKEKDFIVSENLNDPILDYFDNIYKNKDDSYANARTVRNFFEKAIKKQTNRIAKLDNPSKKDLQELLYEDLF